MAANFDCAAIHSIVYTRLPGGWDGAIFDKSAPWHWRCPVYIGHGTSLCWMYNTPKRKRQRAIQDPSKTNGKLHSDKDKNSILTGVKLHQWIGRTIAILGVTQVALGLTLYGSPKVLFILFTVWTFLILLVYFILSYRNQPEMGFDDRSTYITERTESSRRSRGGHGMGRLAAAGAAGAGLAALSRRRSRSRSRRSRQEVLSSRHSSRHSRHSDSYVENEKYREDGRRGRTWKDRLFGVAAAGGGLLAVRSLFNRNKKHTVTESGSDVSYSRPVAPSEVTQTDLSRLEEGRAPASPANDRWRRVEEQEAAQAAALAGSPLRHGHRPARSGGSIDSFDSRTSFSDDHDARPKESHNLRNGIAALGVAGFLKHQWNKRRNKKEDAHVEALRQQDLEEERMARANSNRRKYTGDGLAPPRRNRPPSTIISESDISGATPAASRTNLPAPTSHIPPPPRSTANLVTTAGPSTTLPPAPISVLSGSGSEGYTSAGGGRHRRHQAEGSAAAAGVAVPVAGPRDSSRQRSSREGSVASPPVSVKVKMHNDGRHVTLRRLNEEEAAAEREARRRERRNRDGSVSSLSNFGNDRWRRTEALEAQQAQQTQQAPPPSAPIRMPEPVIPGALPGPPPGPPPVPTSLTPLPPPPPLPGASGSIMSSPPGTNVYGESDVSNYNDNRRRRRAERAQAKQARQGGGRVEFS